MTPLAHQVKFAKDYTGKRLIVWEGGVGKTIAGCLWLHDGRDSDALVICPKRVVKKWRETLKLWDTKATVLSKEDFTKTTPKAWSAIVVDEADEFASPLFTKGRSFRSLVLYDLLKEYPTQTLLLTATPIRSNPWNLHSLLCFLGTYVDYKEWRKTYFDLLYPGAWSATSRPYLVRPSWVPKDNWRTLARAELEKHADIVLLKDCVGDLPPVEEETIKVKGKPFVKPKEWEASAAFHEERRHEQAGKHKTILEIGKAYRKVLVVAYYVEQVEELAKQLGRDRETFVVYGGVKDQEDILKKANESDECFLIVQAELGVGFDADTFSCVVFASLAYGVQKLVQMKYRVRRIHNLHPVKYYYLLGGRCDEAVKKSVDLGKDFTPSEWQN